jgi:transcriptional regulator with XRE-family HTH domain
MVLAMNVQANSCKPDPFIAALPTDPRERAAFALKVGVDQSTVWRWATRKSRPNSEAMRARIALALRRELAELFPPEEAAA